MILLIFRLNFWLILFSGYHPVLNRISPDTMESAILHFVNEDRQIHGLQPLKMNSLESSLAYKHSLDMASGKVGFGHDGFSSRANSIQKSLGSTEIGENVALGQMTAREVVDGWLKSPPHKKNIEGNFVLTGIGYARDKKGEIYFTQIFSR